MSGKSATAKSGILLLLATQTLIRSSRTHKPEGSAPFSRDGGRSLALKSPVQATLKAEKRSAEMGILLNGVFWSHRQPSSRGPGDRFKTLSPSSRLERRCMQAPWTPGNDLIRNRSWPIRKILKKIFRVKNFRLSLEWDFLAESAILSSIQYTQT